MVLVQLDQLKKQYQIDVCVCREKGLSHLVDLLAALVTPLLNTAHCL